MTKMRLLTITIVTVAALFRFVDVFRPIDRTSWREGDVGSIARNFATESMNLFYPRIDWRGNGEGFVESEFPIYPWLVALGYKLFGLHDQIGRLITFVFSLGTLFFFYRLCRLYLDELSSTVALAYFAFNPLIVVHSTSIQPEGLMMLSYICAAYFFLRWFEHERERDFILAIVATALTILAKATSAHIIILIGLLFLLKYRFTLFHKIRVWFFMLSSLLPSFVWYLHGREVWRTSGNSLGISNAHHWVGLDFFTNSFFIRGILSWELIYVWVGFALVIGLFGVWHGYQSPAVRLVLLWFFAIFCYYFTASRSTAEVWAVYYHIFSIPPAALLVGYAFGELRIYRAGLSENALNSPQYGSWRSKTLYASVLTCFVLAFAIETAYAFRHDLIKRFSTDPTYSCALEAKRKMTKSGLIVATGGDCVDRYGYGAPYNISYMFYWLERKGFSMCVQEQSVENLLYYSQNGATYFVAEMVAVDQISGFERELDEQFELVSACDGVHVYDIGTRRSTLSP